MTTQISVEIFSLKGILPTLYKENKNSLLFFKSALDNITLESSECVLSDEECINFTNQSIVWTVDTLHLKTLKSSQPKLKIQIEIRKPGDNTSKTIGFCLIDLRDIGKDKVSKWLKVHSIKNAEMLVKAKQVDLLPLHTSLLKPDVKEGQNSDNRPIYSFKISIDSFQNFKEYLSSISINLKYVLTWQLFGQKFQSEEFTENTLPSPIEDIIQVQCSFDSIVQKIASQFPLVIQLVSSDPTSTIIASSSITFKLEQFLQLNNPVDFYYKFPESLFEFIPESGYISRISSNPNMKVSIELSSDTSSLQKNKEIPLQALESDDHVQLYDDDFDDDDNFNLVEPAKLSVEPVIQKNDKKLSNVVEENVKDLLHHYRICIDARSLRQFKRPFHAVVIFSYPHFGVTAVIRTSPVWVLPHTETRIDNGCAVYDCCLTERQFNDILINHPLKISITSKSQHGINTVGEIHIDLSYVNSSPPVAYRCILTNKTFFTEEEYNQHWNSLSALVRAGRLDTLPPKNASVIRALDSLFPITSDPHDPSIDGSQLRARIIIEDLGLVGPKIAIDVNPGYKQHNGGVYDDFPPPSTTVNIPNLSNTETASRPITDQTKTLAFEEMKADWEIWQRNTEIKWQEAMREKEIQIRSRLESEAAQKLTQQANDLKKAHEEASRLEIRLRQAIEGVERQKLQLTLKEEEMNVRLAQRTAELQLLQRRVRDEAKIKIDAEVRKSEALENHIIGLKAQLEQMEKRYKESENDFESYRKRQRNTPETVLREETARLKAQLAESKAETERERRLCSEEKLEKELMRSQVHRLALALKREKERNSALARQDLEQLRLEFLAREERYVLDGDREELRNIKNDLAALRFNANLSNQNQSPNIIPSSFQKSNLDIEKDSVKVVKTDPNITSQIDDKQDTVIMKSVDQSLISNSDLDIQEVLRTLPPITNQNNVTSLTNKVDSILVESNQDRDHYLQCIAELTNHIEDLLKTGRYSEGDPAIIALSNERSLFEALLNQNKTSNI